MSEESIKATQEVDQFEMDPEALENSLAEMDSAQIDEFNSDVDFEKFIVLSKKDLTNFCRIVEPLTKASIDDYGKSVFVKCLDNERVELSYCNDPYFIKQIVPNKSGKQVKSFAVLVSNLKKLVTNSFASLILVEENNEINIALCEQLLFLETKPLKEAKYEFDFPETVNDIDKELANYTFRKVGAMLSLTDRASEKVIVVKNNNVTFNTAIFASRSKSPFGESDDFVLYKQVSDVIGVLSEISKTSLKYAFVNKSLVVSCDSTIFCQMPVGTGSKVDEFQSPVVDNALKFDATVSIINDNLLRLVSTVLSLDYLSDIVTISFSKDDMEFKIVTSNQSKVSSYKFSIAEGAPEVLGEMKLSAQVLKVFLQIVGLDVKYSFNSNGLGIKNELGNFLIRKSA